MTKCLGWVFAMDCSGGVLQGSAWGAFFKGADHLGSVLQGNAPGAFCEGDLGKCFVREHCGGFCEGALVVSFATTCLGSIL